MAIKWTRQHKSTCGRFWCYKPPRSEEWQLFDRNDRDANGACKRHYLRKLAEAKAYAEVILASELRTIGLAPCGNCMLEDGVIKTPSGSCPEHGWMVC